MISWKKLEEKVRTIAQYKWNTTAVAEPINGVDFDCVLKPEKNNWIVIEITENHTLNKVRDDIIKLNTCRLSLFTSKNIFVTGYVILAEEPTSAMITAANENFVKVLSVKTFSNEFLDFNSYSHIRSEKIFGSSVNPFSGKKDNIKYTPVHYSYLTQNKEVTIKDISKSLLGNKRIILLGNYGTGKSRCVRELFEQFSKKNNNQNQFIYPIAINLKDNWGTKRGEEIIRRHFEDLGLDEISNSVIKLLDSDKLLFLLDGFDEIGAQVWSDDPTKLQQIRNASLSGVKDLIEKTGGSVIITGREHYFNTNNEMFKALGLTNETNPPLTITCKDEFSESEMEVYLKSLSQYISLPSWLPRRPIICQIINELKTEEIERLFIDTSDSIEFWDTLIKNLCKREARINALLDSDIIFKIFIQIAEITRFKVGNLGPLSSPEINSAFEKVVGTSPVEESALMLQRLPALGRISSESKDRQFIDLYILDGLRAEGLVSYIETFNEDILNSKWVNRLGKLGCEIIVNRIIKNRSANSYLEYLKRAIDKDNRIIIGDILSSLVLSAKTKMFDIGGLKIENTELTILNLSTSLADNFTIEDSYIEKIDISNSCSTKITIKDCIIKNIYGANKHNIPDFLIDNTIENYFESPIEFKETTFNYTPAQMIFISILKKVYLSSNTGKKENELINSNRVNGNKELSQTILNYLMREKIIGRSKEKQDVIYKSKSFEEKRIQKILNDLENSKDKLWKNIPEK